MAGKQEKKSQLKVALKSLKVKQGELLACKEYGDRVVVVTRHGQKLIWYSNNRRG